MNHLTRLSDKRLREQIARLKRDIESFEHRAGLRRTILERQDRYSPSDPLYQRLTSIRDHMRVDLKQAQEALEARGAGRARRPGWSLRSAVASLVGART